VRIASATVRGTAAERQIVPAEMCADPANTDTPHAPAILTIMGRDADAAAATKATSTGARLLFAPRKHGNADTSHAPGCVYRRRTAGHAAARPGNRSGSLNRRYESMPSRCARAEAASRPGHATTADSPPLWHPHHNYCAVHTAVPRAVRSQQPFSLSTETIRSMFVRS
jgi:hypothetical protein